jgi:putative glycosyltransferase
MLISVVTSLYKSQKYVLAFYNRMTVACQSFTLDYEIIFVDDGSPDNSKEVIKNIIDADKKVRLIELSRNFGAIKARWTGLNYIKGEYTFILDADLEESPELIIDFYKIIKDNENTDVVYGYVNQRKGGFFERISGKIFYDSFSFFSGIEIEKSPVWVRLMKRKYVDALVLHTEYHPLAIGIMHIVGFQQKGVEIVKGDKKSSTYSLRKKISQAIDSVLSFSNKPLEYISIIGLLISMLSMSYFVFLIFNKLLYNQVLIGWTSVIASVLLIGGIQLFSIGIIGMYLGKIFEQVKGRPNTIIRNLYNID